MPVGVTICGESANSSILMRESTARGSSSAGSAARTFAPAIARARINRHIDLDIVIRIPL